MTVSRWEHCKYYSGYILLLLLVLVMIRYIENMDISFSISIYHIVSYRWKKYWIFRYTYIHIYIYIYIDIFLLFKKSILPCLMIMSCFYACIRFTYLLFININTDIAIFVKCRIDIISKLKSWYWVTTNYHSSTRLTVLTKRWQCPIQIHIPYVIGFSIFVKTSSFCSSAIFMPFCHVVTS